MTDRLDEIRKRLEAAQQNKADWRMGGHVVREKKYAEDIAYLLAEVERLQGKLKPFALTADDNKSEPDGQSCMVLVGWCREAKAALNGQKQVVHLDPELREVVARLEADGLVEGKDFRILYGE